MGAKNKKYQSMYSKKLKNSYAAKTFKPSRRKKLKISKSKNNNKAVKTVDQKVNNIQTSNSETTTASGFSLLNGILFWVSILGIIVTIFMGNFFLTACSVVLLVLVFISDSQERKKDRYEELNIQNVSHDNISSNLKETIPENITNNDINKKENSDELIAIYPTEEEPVGYFDENPQLDWKKIRFNNYKQVINKANRPNSLDYFNVTEYFNQFKVDDLDSYADVILLNYFNNRPANYKVPNNFLYLLDIPDLNLRQSQYIEKGLLKVAPPDIQLNTFKVTELKDILRQNNLKVSGKKAELIIRLIDNLDSEKINELLAENEPVYVLSDKSKELIDSNSGLIWLSKNSLRYDISINDLKAAYKIIGKDKSFGEVMNFIYQFVTFSDNCRYRNFEMSIYHILKEQKNYRNALYYLLLNITRHIKDGYENEYTTTEVISNPTNSDELRELKEYYSNEILTYVLVGGGSKENADWIIFYEILINDILNGYEITRNRIDEVYKEVNKKPAN